jgi:hypothetical protein
MPSTGKVFLGGQGGSWGLCESEGNVSETQIECGVPILSSVDIQVTTYSLTAVHMDLIGGLYCLLLSSTTNWILAHEGLGEDR